MIRGKISPTAQGLKSPNLIVSPFGLIRLCQAGGILFCGVSLQTPGNGWLWGKGLSDLWPASESQHTALTPWLLMVEPGWRQRLLAYKPVSACQCHCDNWTLREELWERRKADNKSSLQSPMRWAPGEYHEGKMEDEVHISSICPPHVMSFAYRWNMYTKNHSCQNQGGF